MHFLSVSILFYVWFVALPVVNYLYGYLGLKSENKINSLNLFNPFIMCQNHLSLGSLSSIPDIFWLFVWCLMIIVYSFLLLQMT